MSVRTTNFNFVKPELSDIPDITQTNENWDKLDLLLNKDVFLASLSQDEETIIVNLNFTIHDGTMITFKTPCDNDEFNTLLVNYPNGNTVSSIEFVVKNAANELINEVKGSFVQGAYISVSLDTTNQIAYIHNEVTTIVPDGSIDLIKFADSVNNLLNNTPLKPDLLNLPTVYANDGDCYGELFFYFSSTQQYKVFDAETLETLYSGVIEGNLKPHANAVSFGLKDESETFPYIYITGYNGKYFDDSSLPPGVCGVYKISDNYELTLIQTINISFVSTDLWLGDRSITSTGIIQYGNFVVDYDNEFLYVFSSLADNGIAKTRIFKFDLPNVSSSNVELDSSDILEYYDVPFYPFLQGAKCYDDKLYIGYGETESVNETGVAIIDLINHKQIGIIDLSDLLPEVECVFFYKNNLYVNSGATYKIDRYSPITNIGDLSKLKTTPNNNVVSGINYIFDNMVYNHKEELTITRTENNYVNLTDFSRIHAYRVSGLIIVYVFLKISSSMPTTARYITIGNINLDGFTPIIPSGYASIVMAPQEGGTENGNLTIECTNNGEIMISNFSDKPCNTWYKGKLIIL